MINFMKVKARVASVEKEIENGGNLAEVYANYSNCLAADSGEDEEEYESLQEIEVYLINKIVSEFMKQNGYSRNENDFLKRWEREIR